MRHSIHLFEDKRRESQVRRREALNRRPAEKGDMAILILGDKNIDGTPVTSSSGNTCVAGKEIEERMETNGNF